MSEVDSSVRPARAAAQPGGAARSDSPLKTWSVTLAICLACSSLVSIATVLLRPIQEEQRRAAHSGQIAEVLRKQPGLSTDDGTAATPTLEEQVIDLQTGLFAPDIDPAQFDPVLAARDPSTSRAIAPERDLARIVRQARHAAVTMVRQGPAVEAIVLPIYGRGYASIIQASITLAGDGNTIVGLVIREHGETPGIGSEITKPDWLQQWVGKKLRDEQGQFRFHVAVDEGDPPEGDASFHVDGISGATRSSEGVSNMMRFWLGDDGFGPFLARLQKGELR